MSQLVVKGLMEGVSGEVRGLVLALYDVFASAFKELYDLVKSFDEDLSRGVVDVDEYYREAEAVVRKIHLDAYYVISRLNEALGRHPEFRVLPNAAFLDALYILPGLLAGVLFRTACGFEGPRRGVVVLLGYSYLVLAGGRPLDAVVFLLASIALARARDDVAAELLRKIGVDLVGIVNFACGAVELAKFLEDRGIGSIPE
ncbi:MAG: hypothetical protein RQ839_08930 [Thermoproteus sp.]|jgi:hypothetical protein|nr:hypothetical protein [Thermoproteus sp.]MDT7882334.1 hypothetical protein [Thermoproteus sp.]